jgi:hypothetical protein
MDLGNFHDGSFDGLRIGPNKTVQLFLKTVDKKSYKLHLRGVEKLNISDVRQGNIIVDLVICTAEEITPEHIQHVNGLPDSDPWVAKGLEAAREQNLQILELNPSYGAEGTILFESFELKSEDSG